MDIVFLVLFSVGASFIQRVTGFGFGIFIMTILPSIMPSYGESTTLSGILSASMSFFLVIKYRKLISWRRLIPILSTFLIFSYLAISMVSFLQDSYLQTILGVVLVLMGIYFLFINNKLHIRPTMTMQLSMGSFSGIMGGLFAMQGPPAVLYFIASESDKDRYMAIVQTYFLVGNIFMTIVRVQHGFFSSEVCYGVLYASVGIVIGTILGNIIYKKISIDILRKIVYFYLIISGVVALLK